MPVKLASYFFLPSLSLGSQFILQRLRLKPGNIPAMKTVSDQTGPGRCMHALRWPRSTRNAASARVTMATILWNQHITALNTGASSTLLTKPRTLESCPLTALGASHVLLFTEHSSQLTLAHVILTCHRSHCLVIQKRNTLLLYDKRSKNHLYASQE